MRNLIRRIALAAFVLLMTGCAAAIKRNSSDTALSPMPASAATKLVLNVSGSNASTSAKDWGAFKEEWRVNFAEKAKAAHVEFEMQEGAAKPTGENGVLLVVHVEDYRFMRPGTRYVVGIMAGNAYIQSKLTFLNLSTGDSFGSQYINTSSSAWEGVFSAMTNKQVEAIADDAIKQIRSSSR